MILFPLLINLLEKPSSRSGRVSQLVGELNASRPAGDVVCADGAGMYTGTENPGANTCQMPVFQVLLKVEIGYLWLMWGGLETGL